MKYFMLKMVGLTFFVRKTAKKRAQFYRHPGNDLLHMVLQVFMAQLIT
jgi:hypothetical protein